MVWLMRKCAKCGRYTLRMDSCPYCRAIVRIPHPANFSPDDKYAIYKGMMRNLTNEKNNNNRESSN